MKIKCSKYNIFLDNENLLFNTKKLSLIELDEKSKKALLTEDFEKLTEEEINILKENGIIIPQDVDEVDLLKLEYWNNKMSNNVLHLSIMTTLKCNFKCIYCFEKRVNLDLKEDVKSKILKFIEHEIKNYKALHIDWYGGEPLLNMNMIRELSKNVIELCKKQKIQYASTITTNGYNLNKSIVDELVKYNVKSAQITIDGPEEIHNQRRMLNNDGKTFNTIIENIKYACKFINISLRVNVDKNTAEKSLELLEFLKKNDLTDLSVSIKGVISSDENPVEEYELTAEEFAIQALKFYKYAQKLGFDISVTKLLEDINRRFCIVDLDSQYIISPTGELYKCGDSFTEQDLGKIGKIDKYGNEVIDEYKKSKWVKDPFNDENCNKCNILPICMGGCTMKRIYKKGSWCLPELKFCLEEVIALKYKELVGESI